MQWSQFKEVIKAASHAWSSYRSITEGDLDNTAKEVIAAKAAVNIAKVHLEGIPPAREAMDRALQSLERIDENLGRVFYNQAGYDHEFGLAGIEMRKFCDSVVTQASKQEHSLNDPTVRKQVYNLTGGKCAYCDTQLVESGGEQDQFCVEHVVPASLGGPNHLVNYVPSCRSCNNSKGDRHVLYFIRNSFVLRNRAPAPVSPVTPIAEAAE